MARPLRIEYPGAWYHVMNRGRRAESIFTGNDDYGLFVDLLKESCELWNINVSAYCLMSNHYHLLIQTPEGNLSRCMRHINGIYTQRYNRIHHCDGQLFRGRFKSILIEEDSYLLQLVRYIHRNPLRAGLVKKLDMYPWCSHKGYRSEAEKWNWLYKDYILSILTKDENKRKKTYQQFMSDKDSAELISMFESRQIPSILGGEKFINWVKDIFFDKKEHIEVPESILLAPTHKKIKEVVCEFYGVQKEQLEKSTRGVINEPRNVAIYLSRLLRKEKLDEICKEYSMNRYSAASSAIERVRKQISGNRQFKNRVDNLKALIIGGKSQTKT